MSHLEIITRERQLRDEAAAARDEGDFELAFLHLDEAEKLREESQLLATT